MSIEQPPTVRQIVSRGKLAIGAAAFFAAVALATGLADSIGAYTAIAIGSALGGIGRYWCSGAAARLFGETFPWGTLIINVIGSFVIGLLVRYGRGWKNVFRSGGAPIFDGWDLRRLYDILVVQLTDHYLMHDGEWLQAGGNVVLSVVLCLFAVWLGQVVAIGVTGLRPG